MSVEVREVIKRTPTPGWLPPLRTVLAELEPRKCVPDIRGHCSNPTCWDCRPETD